MAAVALVASNDVAVRDLSVARERLAMMRVWIDGTDDPAVLGDAVRTLYEVREWARIRKVAGDLRVEATRLEAAALRNIGLLGKDGQDAAGLTNMQRAASNGFASLTDAEFAALLDEAGAAQTPATIWNIERRRRAAEFRRTEGASWATDPGGRVGVWDGEMEPEALDALLPRRVAEAARTILTAAVADGEAFTIAATTDRLVEWIGEHTVHPPHYTQGANVITDPAFRTGVAEVVRRSLSTEASATGVPQFVTFVDGNEGWSRVHWSAASLDELAQMARYRRKQADEMAVAASELEALVESLTRVSDANGGESRLAALVPIYEHAESACPTCHLVGSCECDGEVA